VRIASAIRAVLIGWAVLLVVSYLIERPVLFLLARPLGRAWFPSVRIVLDCLTLALTGWFIGRFHRAQPMLAILAFAVTLCFGDLEPLLAVNVPWLLQLAGDAVRSSVYLQSLGTTFLLHGILFGSLWAGGKLSQPPAKPPSIIENG
jgi:hypothetical protein